MEWLSPTGRRVWKFQLGKQEVVPSGEILLPTDPKQIKPSAARDWKALLSPQIHIAWLPAKDVFIRAVQLPGGDPSELVSMVEFQIDKISPLPVNQIVWTAHGVVHPDGQQQTALVVIAARSAVEEFLDTEVAAGFVANQLDLPLVRWWSGLALQGDGLYLLTESAADRSLVLAGWHVGGVWRDINLLHLPVGIGPSDSLIRQLGQTAWAGEMEGWLHGIPRVYLGAEEKSVMAWTPELTEWSGQPVVPLPLPESASLALETAKALSEPTASGLMPAEWVALQRQKFIDRLWLNGLGALGVAYLLFLFTFLIALNVRKYQRDDLRSEVSAMGINFTNTLQLKAQVAILEEQVALRYAALDAWQAVANALPSPLTLTQLDFQRGRTLQLSGTVPAESSSEVTRFNSELKKAVVNDKPLFANVKPAQISSRPGATSATWSFEAEVRRGDAP